MKFTTLYCLLLFSLCNCSPKLPIKQQILFDQEGNITYCNKYILVSDHPNLTFRDTITDIRYSLDSTAEIVIAYTKQGDTLWKLNPFKVLNDEGWIDNIHNPKKIRDVKFVIHKPRLNYPDKIPVLYVGSYGHSVYAFINLVLGKCYFDRQN
jgi:hypothetical protein